MKVSYLAKEITIKQIQIIKLLFDKEYLQKDLQEELAMTAPNLHYHLSRLEKANLIKKETLHKVGNAKINQISLNPASRQQVRQILGYKTKHFTLLTGFGTLDIGYKIPDEVYRLLKKNYYPVSRIICFTSQDALEKRKKHQESENLLDIDKYYEFPYDDYRNIESEFFKKVEHIISEEMKEADIIIDLTPISKLFSLKLLELANKYRLPCVYCGKDKNGKHKLLSMSNMKIKGKIKQFN